MRPRTWGVLLVAAGLVGWWHSPLSPRDRGGDAPRAVAGSAPVCPPPPLRSARLDPPLQSPVPDDVGEFALEPARLTPLAGFALEARVLSREDYRFGRESALSPTDLALGWGRMQEDAVLDRLRITQSGRWYHYRWQDAPPLPPREIVQSSANMHFIPADPEAARALARVRPGDRVRVQGWLVEAVASDGWTWRSSLSRDDSGDGACELVYVCSLQRL